jgi:predicted nucleic acid-binding protein
VADVTSPPLLYLVDTNVYVAAAKEPAVRQRFKTFLERNGPLRVSAIVLAEVLMGISDAARHQAVAEALAAGTAIVAPTAGDWARAAAAVVHLGGDRVTKGRSFWNDALLAAQCARLDVTLITHNTADFRRLGRYIGVRVERLLP